MSKKKKKPRLVSVEWVDSSYSAGWTQIEDIPNRHGNHVSVGFLLYDGKKTKSVAGHIGPNQALGIIAIPVCSIKKIKFL
jgi:hypothetical protein